MGHLLVQEAQRKPCLSERPLDLEAVPLHLIHPAEPLLPPGPHHLPMILNALNITVALHDLSLCMFLGRLSYLSAPTCSNKVSLPPLAKLLF